MLNEIPQLQDIDKLTGPEVEWLQTLSAKLTAAGMPLHTNPYASHPTCTYAQVSTSRDLVRMWLYLRHQLLHPVHLC